MGNHIPTSTVNISQLATLTQQGVSVLPANGAVAPKTHKSRIGGFANHGFNDDANIVKMGLLSQTSAVPIHL